MVSPKSEHLCRWFSCCSDHLICPPAGHSSCVRFLVSIKVIKRQFNHLPQTNKSSGNHLGQTAKEIKDAFSFYFNFLKIQRSLRWRPCLKCNSNMAPLSEKSFPELTVNHSLHSHHVRQSTVVDKETWIGDATVQSARTNKITW